MASCARIVCDRTRIACCGQSALARLHEMVTEVKVDRDERKGRGKIAGGRDSETRRTGIVQGSRGWHSWRIGGAKRKRLIHSRNQEFGGERAVFAVVFAPAAVLFQDAFRTAQPWKPSLREENRPPFLGSLGPAELSMEK